MLNTLANHGFLPHNGKDISESVIVQVFGDVLNFDPAFSQFLHGIALRGNPAPNATTFSLNNLDAHKLFEHDSSLRFVIRPILVLSHVLLGLQTQAKLGPHSRADSYWGDAVSFNQTIFDQTQSHWTDPIVDLKSKFVLTAASFSF
jgi:hypothetical protein